MNAAATPAPTPAAVCPRATVALDTTLSSATARNGEPFAFTVTTATALENGAPIAAGSKGMGLVSLSEHAARGGHGGLLAVETRYVLAPDGTHVPAIIDRTAMSPGRVSGESRNMPGVLGAIPLAGWVLGPYGYLHHGADVALEKGSLLTVVLGDGMIGGLCR